MTTMYDIERRLMALETRLSSIASREASIRPFTNSIYMGVTLQDVTRQGSCDVQVPIPLFNGGSQNLVVNARDWGFIGATETIPANTNVAIAWTQQSGTGPGQWWLIVADCADTATSPLLPGNIFIEETFNAALLLMEERRRRRVVVRRRIEDDWYQTNNRLLEGGGPDDPGGPA